MKVNYLLYAKDLNELKKKYRQKAFELHPDKGGDDKEMRMLIDEYKYFSENFKVYEYEMAKLDQLLRRIDKLINIKGLNIEIINECIWVTGKTFENKEKIKSLNFKYSKLNKAWYYVFAYFLIDNTQIQKLRDMHGTKKYK